MCAPAQSRDGREASAGMQVAWQAARKPVLCPVRAQQDGFSAVMGLLAEFAPGELEEHVV